MRRLNRVETGSNLVAAGLILVLVFLVVSEVVLRFLFNKPLVGALESSELIMVAIVFLSIAYTQAHRAHIVVEVVTSRLQGKTRHILEAFVLVLCLATYTIIFWESGKSAVVAWQVGDVSMGLIAFPTWPSKMLVPVGTFILCLRFAVQICQELAQLRSTISPKVNR
ncbi:TRAP transporter small permease subunit [Chloroflexota bacterium]